MRIQRAIPHPPSLTKSKEQFDELMRREGKSYRLILAHWQGNLFSPEEDVVIIADVRKHEGPGNKEAPRS